MKLTQEQIKSIPEKLITISEVELSKQFNVHPQSIRYWVRRSRAKGVEIITKVGRRPVQI